MKNLDFFQRKRFVLRIGKVGKFAAECASNDIISKNGFSNLIVFSFKFGKIRKFDEEKVFSEKNAFIFLKGSFNKIGWRKICRWWRTVLFLVILKLHIDQYILNSNF